MALRISRCGETITVGNMRGLVLVLTDGPCWDLTPVEARTLADFLNTAAAQIE